MDLPITITRKKIKNMYLRVHQDGTVSVSAPKRASDKVIWDFINSKADWITTQRQKLLNRQNTTSKEYAYVTGETHYFWGQPCTLLVEETTGHGSVTFVENPHFGEENAPKDENSAMFGILHMCAPQNSTIEQRGHLLTEFYRKKLKLVVPDLLEKYVAIVGKVPAEWHIRSMKTKWGTCNVQDKRIWLALNLAKKHPKCLEYVIAHELTHLHVPNHSKAFWARMDEYFPQWREVRKLLND